MTNPQMPKAEGKRILLVEDDDANRQLMEDYLDHHDYVVSSIATGLDFLQIVIDFQPDLILLDLKLPDISGYLLLEQLQASSMFSRIPVIVISAFAFRAEQKRALELGARQYFIKPLNLMNLRQSIEQEIDP
ncbi:response regulator [Oculatella sp. FACHB-28]|uniref:response regulator n=1 Tax=Cyanophyceae TaxID=3028117 RepID=UPI00168563E4|nr:MULTISPECIES: response regulator [Cyanophyceae]MBD1870099.1 response regulator [Cyanobacteria bacterium FACHB-471]MBD1998427.1 response regulator [Leptolyngbya sp. FACHB-541]MBD2055132.1 response regulator [Oculatella sp. FACHB-28]MBD2071140.1 response regulator [Leptolyngbya sp. FACHB-671]